MKHQFQIAMLAVPIVFMTSCHPTLTVSHTTEGTVWTDSRLRGERQGRSLSSQQIQLLAAWINAHKDGWDLDPFVPYVPCVYVILEEADIRVGSVNIGSSRLIVQDGTQYTRPISDAEHEELLASIGVEAK